MDLAVVDLNRSHAPYLQSQFALHADYGRLLGRLLGALDLGRGRMWAIVPAERVEMAVADLETDAIRGEAERDAVIEAVARQIRPVLDADGPRFLSFEYWIPTYLDGFSPIPQFLVGDSLFEYATASSSAEQIECLLRSSLWFPTVGMIAPIPDGVDLASTRELAPAQIEQAVARVDLVLVGAWCADGYVVWEGSGQSGR